MKKQGAFRVALVLSHALLILICACGNASSDAGSSSATCNWPAGADTFDTTTNQGCRPRPTFEICQVPSGSVIEPDGGVLTPDGGAVHCDDACSSTQYALTCSSSASSGQIPPPDPSLSCTIIAIPTPSNADFYCCACSP
jgi:hypothetical protein